MLNCSSRRPYLLPFEKNEKKISVVFQDLKSADWQGNASIKKLIFQNVVLTGRADLLIRVSGFCE